MFRKLFVLATLLMLSGCFGNPFPSERTSTLDQSQRENVAQKATSDFAVAVAPPPVEVEVKGKDGSTTTVRQPVPSQTTASAVAGENSDSQAKGSSDTAVTIPLFVKIIGIAFGLCMLVIALALIAKVLKQSAALKAAWAYGDAALANVVHSIRTQATVSADPTVLNTLKAVESEAERQRAELNKD